ncbi:phosphoglucosamine mutase [Aliidongia dinghuensis]|uniref:Phosphoglucosamine mutase n=1 Tax=Aliidongia dinghuensis TaxID=1867774 RepID=A0A8J2YSU0_9PROT|nr:phosphoglucosamine mutase [Aliidongia dinghuensis]GGF16923.1 phosphoglucosamine mutase [Aliidongia dinghuensis]
MTRKLFGTDGIRGTANTAPMTADVALKVAVATARHFRRGTHRHLVVIGKDTRLSGYMLEPALTAGFISMGMDCVLVGPIPTPAIAMLTRSLRADLGVMISASHNPYEDNGIKLFGPDGHKLSDEIEAAIEASVAAGADHDLAPPAQLGRARRLEDAGGRYIEWVKNTLPRGMRLDGIRIVVDCAHGAAYKVAPSVLYELGAEVIPLGVSPDGFNINRESGAMATGAMQKAVIEHKADIGLALDGDADRLLVADETGALLDGDQLMGLIASRAHRAGTLRGGGLVATVMSNLGLERYLGGLGLTLARTAVGDRYVFEHMRDNGFNVGGEQSGHIILSDYATTGDGILAALQVLAAMIEAHGPLSQVGRIFTPLPQRLKNVRFAAGTEPLKLAKVKDAVQEAEARLNGTGRLLLRKSGTEPVIRVMAEAEDEALVAAVVDDLSAVIAAVAGAPAATGQGKH